MCEWTSLCPSATLCDPYLNLFRGIIPPIGGTIDLSPILAFTVLNVFTNTAAALPCEVNPDGTLKQPEVGYASRVVFSTTSVCFPRVCAIHEQFVLVVRVVVARSQLWS